MNLLAGTFMNKGNLFDLHRSQSSKTINNDVYFSPCDLLYGDALSKYCNCDIKMSGNWCLFVIQCSVMVWFSSPFSQTGGPGTPALTGQRYSAGGLQRDVVYLG